MASLIMVPIKGATTTDRHWQLDLAALQLASKLSWVACVPVQRMRTRVLACMQDQQDVHLPVCLLVHGMRAVQCPLEVPRVSHVCSCVSGLFRALHASNELTERP